MVHVQVLDDVLGVLVVPADPVADQDRDVRAGQGHEEGRLQTRVYCQVLHQAVRKFVDNRLSEFASRGGKLTQP